MAQTRRLRVPKFATKKQRRQIKSARPTLPGVLRLTKQTLSIIRHNRRYFIRFTLLYLVCSFIFVQTASNTGSVIQAKELIGNSLGSAFVTNLALYGSLVGSSTQLGNQAAALYQFIIIVVFSLALIYGLRHMYGKDAEKVTVKQSLYRGMTPLIPLLLVLLCIALQLLPLSLGTSIYATVLTSGIAVNNIEQLMWLSLTVVLAAVSLYWVVGSISALFIVTLPDTKPLEALRSSRQLARFRRLVVLRKILFMPLVLLVLLGVIVLPFIAFAPAVAQFVFFVVSSVALPLAVTYMYNLYRSML